MSRREQRIIAREERRAAQRAATQRHAAQLESDRAAEHAKGFRPKLWDTLGGVALPLTVAALIPENNYVVFGCLAAASVIACVPVYWHTEVAKIYRAGYCAIVGLVCFGLFLVIKHENLQKELAKFEGVLEPANEPGEDRKCTPDDASAVALYFGLHTFFIQTFPQVIIRIAGREILTLDRVGKNISIVAMALFDDAGAIATIDSKAEHNKFWVSPNVRKVRPDKSTLIVYDRNANEVLSLRYLNEKTIAVTGTFKYAGRPPLVVRSNYFQMGGISGTGRGCSPGAPFKDSIYAID